MFNSFHALYHLLLHYFSSILVELHYFSSSYTILVAYYSAAEKGKVLFSTIYKPENFGLDMPTKENFLVYLSQFIFLIIKLVPGNVVMAGIYICDNGTIRGNWIYAVTWKHVLLFMLFVYLFVCLSA